MKSIAALIILVSANFASAASTVVCTMPYSVDVFKTDLRLAVSAADNLNTQGVLWMDTHIPYGIRPYPYVISEVACNDNEVSVKGAYSNLHTVVFNSTVGSDKGTLTYYSKEGVKSSTLTLNCSAETVAALCSK